MSGKKRLVKLGILGLVAGLVGLDMISSDQSCNQS